MQSRDRVALVGPVAVPVAVPVSRVSRVSRAHQSRSSGSLTKKSAGEAMR